MRRNLQVGSQYDWGVLHLTASFAAYTKVHVLLSQRSFLQHERYALNQQRHCMKPTSESKIENKKREEAHHQGI